MLNFSSILAAAEASAPNNTANAGGWAYYLVTFGPIVLIFVVMYFLMIRPQRKRQKEEQKMRDNIRVGDEIITIGGICGRVVNIKEDALVIEVGADRNKMTIKKWALQTCETVHDPNEIDDDDDDDDI